jgi:hypothetical protein
MVTFVVAVAISTMLSYAGQWSPTVKLNSKMYLGDPYGPLE